MIKFNITFCFFLFVLLNTFKTGQSILKCYLCADCGDPFDEHYPYTTIVTNQNYGASCIKSVMTVPNGRVVSRGTTFNCQQSSTSDIKIYCCQTDLCNSSNSLKQLTSLVFFPVLYALYFLFY